MLKRVFLLAWPELIDSFGFNEARFTRDVKKRRRVKSLFFLYIFIGILMMGYIGGNVYLLSMFGAAEVIPAYAAALSGILVLFVTAFRAGATVFSLRAYEKQACLPVARLEIVLSRFVGMYIRGVLLAFIITFPASAVYVWAVRPSALFYVQAVISVAFGPLLPVAVATALGAAITMAASRTRHKNAFVVIASVLLTIGVMIGSAYMSARNFDVNALGDMAAHMARAVKSAYPPASLAASGAPGVAAFAVISVLAIAAAVWLVARDYPGVLSRLSASGARKFAAYDISKTRSVSLALYQKEISRYFSSNIYVLNTSIGYIMMAIAALALLILGKDKLSAMIGVPGLIDRYLPFILALMCVIAPSTACAISIEGKQFWIIKSLPVPMARICAAKIAVTFSVAAPMYVITEIIILLAARPTVMGAVWLMLTPAVYIVFSAVVGLMMNVRAPMLDWETETTPVKQGAAVLFTMLACFAGVALPAALVSAVPAYENAAMAVSLVLVIAAAVFVWKRLCRVKLNSIE